MVQVPVRWVSQVSGRAIGSRFRKAVASGSTRTLVAHPAALTILSHVAGRYLTPTQQATLGDVLVEHVSLTACATPESGPLAMTDTLGAILAAAQFVLTAGGQWLVVRIPEWHRPTPDLLAVPSKGGAWRVEIKATAPLAFAHARGSTLDLCDRMYARRREANAQLAARALPMFVGSPLIAAAGNSPLDPTFGHGGAAILMQTIVDAGFGARGDLAHLGRQGCPIGANRCADVCIKGTPAPSIGVLLGEPGRNAGGGRAPPLGWKGMLGASIAGTHAAWSGAASVADAAIAEMITRLEAIRSTSGFLDEERVAALVMLGGLLEATRGLSSRGARSGAVERFVRLGRDWPEVSTWSEGLISEADFGSPASTGKAERMSAPDLLSELRLGSASAEFEVELAGRRYTATRFGSELRLVPSDVTSGILLNADGATARRQAENAILAAVRNAADNARLGDASIELDDGSGDARTWTVGRTVEVGWPISGWMSDDGRMSLRLRD